ncbi:hypothetical protein BH10ACI2_BH10ACI2_06370 [soil metagenome]
MKLNIIFLLVISFFVFGNISAQTQFSASEPRKAYTLGPGDEITVKVLGEVQYDFVATVNEDGRLEIPFGEPVVAKCRTENELKEDVKKSLSKYLKNPEFSFRVTQRKSRPPVTIYGEVKTPHEIDLTRRATLVELLAVSGGTTEEAGGMVQVFRRPPVCSTDVLDDNWTTPEGTVDAPSRFYSLTGMRTGGLANPEILPGDLIYVHRALPVYITGEVVNPAGVYLKERGLSLTEAIGLVSGLRAEAKKKEVKISRLKPNSTEREEMTVDLDLIAKKEQKDVMLQPFDIVVVGKSKDSLAVTILKVAAGMAKAGANAAVTGGGYRIAY